VSLPSNAVQESGTAGIVFVVHGDALERRAVRLAPAAAAASRFCPGSRPVNGFAVGDFNQLKDGAKIRVEQ